MGVVTLTMRPSTRSMAMSVAQVSTRPSSRPSGSITRLCSPAATLRGSKPAKARVWWWSPSATSAAAPTNSLVNPPGSSRGSTNSQGLRANSQGPMSWWESGKPAPARNESRAARPQGRRPSPAPAASNCSQSEAVWARSTNSSKPTSPV